ncbi:MAG: peptidylprolyl isomerase [Burkholderiales bacterium]
MRISTMFYLLFALTAAYAPAAQAQVAKVNGVTIPQSRADILLKDAVAQGRPESPELRDAVKKRLIESEIIAQEAVKLGLQKNAEVGARLDLARQQVLVSAYINEMARRSPASEDAMRQAHERLKDHPAANEFKARHILVASEKEAQDIIAQIKGGASFAKLAAEKSRDEGSKGQGGELQWSVPTGYVRPFAEAMARLKKGTMTETPVQTNFGWHVIRLDDTRPVPFETLKPQLQQIVQRESVQKTIEDLRAKAKIE